MKLIENKITLSELKEMSPKMYDDLVKAVVDVELGVMVVDAGLHSDEEGYLISNGSKQENLWGINLYPAEIDSEDFIEFDSMINTRSSNPSRGVDDPKIQKRIREIVAKLVTK